MALNIFKTIVTLAVLRFATFLLKSPIESRSVNSGWMRGAINVLVIISKSFLCGLSDISEFFELLSSTVI